MSAEARAVELRRAGFKDCLLEVTRLLSSFDGQPNSVPQMEEMRRTLLAHLHQCDQQRDQEAKAYLSHVAAVTNAIGTSSSGPLRQTAPGTGPPTATTTGKSTKRGTSTSIADMVTGSGKSSLPGTRSFSIANTYLPHLDHRMIDNAHSTPAPYIQNINRCTMTPSAGKASLNSSYPYSPMKGLSESGSACCPSTERAYYPTDYIANGKPVNLIDNCVYVTPANSTSLEHGHYSQIPTQHSRLQQQQQQQQQPAQQKSQQLLQQPSASSQHSQSFSTNHSCTNPLGPNESQSTSSPPFHSTPDDADLGTSPNLLLGVGKLTNSTESYSDPSVISIGQMKSDSTVDDNQSHGFPITPNKPVPFYMHSSNPPVTSMSALSVNQLAIKLETQSHDNAIYSSYATSFGSNSSHSVAAYSSHPSNYDPSMIATSMKPIEWCPTGESVGTIHSSQQNEVHVDDYMPQWDYAFQML